MESEYFKLAQVILQGLGLGLVVAIISSALRPFVSFMLEAGSEERRPFDYKSMLLKDDERWFVLIAGFCAGFPIGMYEIFDLNLPTWVLYCFYPFLLVALWGVVILGYMFILVPVLFCMGSVAEGLEKKFKLPDGHDWYGVVVCIAIIVTVVYFFS